MEKELTHFHRYRDYDYSRGAAVFVSFHLEPRMPLFGKVADGWMAYSAVGKIAVRVIAEESHRTPDAQLMKWVVMPDHVHLRIYLRPEQDEPLKKLGRFIYNVKAWTRNLARRELGIELRWQENYHDWLCLSREIIDIVDRYIENNPLKWWLMHGNPPPLKVIEPLASDILPGGEWWSAVGNTALLGGKIASVRLSRSLAPGDFGAVAARLMAAAEKGWTLAGTWISPCERAVFAELLRRDVPVIRASQDPLSMVYRPKGDEPGLFAAGRYLVLSRPGIRAGCRRPAQDERPDEGVRVGCRRPAQDGRPDEGSRLGCRRPAQGGRPEEAGDSPAESRGVGWHGINDALAAIAEANGGAGVYVRREAGRVVWRRAGIRAGCRRPAQCGRPEEAGDSPAGAFNP